MAKKKKKNKEIPGPLVLREHTLFAIKANNLDDASIQEKDSMECLGARSYFTTINTTSNKVTITPNNDKEDNNFRNLTSLGKAETKSLEWSRVGKNGKEEEKVGANNPEITAWIKGTALNPATSTASTSTSPPTVPRPTTIMTISVNKLTPAIQKLIKVITNSNIKINSDDCVMVVAFQQQGIHTFNDLQMFEFTAQFENAFSTYKANDANIGTNSGPDVIIITEIEMCI